MPTDRNNDYASALQQWRSRPDASGDRGAGPAPARAGFAKTSPEQRLALEQVRAWTRARFKLAHDAPILVAELACSIPGCAPRETVVAFWTAARRHHFKLFKPAAEVLYDDLPFAWLLDSLAAPEEGGCDCC